MAYENVFTLGRRVLEQAESSVANYENQTFDVLTTAEPTLKNTHGDDVIGFKVAAKGEGRDIKYQNQNIEND